MMQKKKVMETATEDAQLLTVLRDLTIMDDLVTNFELLGEVQIDAFSGTVFRFWSDEQSLYGDLFCCEHCPHGFVATTYQDNQYVRT
jgi:hypothetical protein